MVLSEVCGTRLGLWSPTPGDRSSQSLWTLEQSLHLKNPEWDLDLVLETLFRVFSHKIVRETPQDHTEFELLLTTVESWTSRLRTREKGESLIESGKGGVTVVTGWGRTGSHTLCWRKLTRNLGVWSRLSRNTQVRLGHNGNIRSGTVYFQACKETVRRRSEFWCSWNSRPSFYIKCFREK